MNKIDIPSDPSLRWEWIKYQLRSRGTSLAELARNQGVSDGAVKNVKRLPYPRMERAIAGALDLQPADLWPERWSENNTPKRSRPRRAECITAYAQKHTATPVLGHVRNGKEG